MTISSRACGAPARPSALAGNAALVLQLGLTPLLFGAIDGIYQGVSGITRIAGGFIGDRVGRYKGVALFGYAASAACRGLLLFVSSGTAIAGVMVADRIRKGIRTAPRDALIALSVRRSDLGTAFGVHRALDSIGATLGPFVAFAVLALAPQVEWLDNDHVLYFYPSEAGNNVWTLNISNREPPRVFLKDVYSPAVVRR